MSKFSKGLVVVVTLVACVAMAGAQGGNGQGQGRRGGQGGGLGQRGGRGGGGELQLAMRHDVQVDLAITDEEKTKLTALSEAQRTAARGQRGQGGGGGNGGGGGAAGAGGTFDREAFMKAQADARAKTHKDLAEILTADQMKRLGEIQIQLAGVNAVTMPEVQTALALTADQKTKITDLQTKQREANQSLQEKQRNNEMTREEFAAARAKNTEALKTELAKVLTADQTAKLKTMGGKEFKADPPTTGGGGN